MAFNLLDIKPTEITRDLSGYVLYLFAAPKLGKTTLCRDANALILATEKGYGAIAGAYVVDIKTWADLKIAVNQLKKKEVKEKFKTVAIDVADNLGPLCEKYICSNNDVDTLGAIPYGGGWTMFKKEIESLLRTIVFEGYGIILTSHVSEKTIKKQDGTEYNIIQASPTSSVHKILANMSDIIAYGYMDPSSHERLLQLRSNDGSVEVGTRFRFMQSTIPFGYQPLVDAINDAIDLEEQGGATVSETVNHTAEVKLSYEDLMKEGNEIVATLLQRDPKLMREVNKIVENILGAGKKFAQCTPNQVEAMSIIVNELKEL